MIKKNIALDSIQEFMEDRSTITCKNGQQFVMEGAPTNGLFFVNKGKAKVLKTGIYGKEQILRFVNDGEIIGHRGFGIREKYSVSAVALEDSVLCNFTDDTLKRMLKVIPELTYDLMLFYAYELNKTESKVKAIAQMSVREKVIDALLYINRKFGCNHRGLLDIKLSRKEIAGFAGTTNEQVTRVISVLKKEELIFTMGKRIGIVNVELLSKEISEHNYFLDS
ncbi:Crp/Fnr family transcriptional regulator [uncultured Winogradskyella sp.]|uniref:Crp/Fnr family transcriptional regulator n=1 Tax=uncultured Winogradskyella sp. TaxID=395353 RepID=UPI00261EB56D|nr:Crp/Fnr family transcriptional regulator [uncultured Winogradskyella sp.]